MHYLKRTLSTVVLLGAGPAIILLLAAGCFIWTFQQAVQLDAAQLGAIFRTAYWGLAGGLWSPIIINPYFYAGAAAIFLLEACIPASKNQPIFSRAILIDIAWTILTVIFIAVFLQIYWSFLTDLFDRFVASNLIKLTVDLPFFAELVIAYLVTDWIGWLHHFVRHKVKVFWAFHTLHHSQRQMNLFTNNRIHPVDYLIARTIRFGPMFLFEHCLEIALVYLFVNTIQDRFNHSNIRTNLGILRYILVTPQSHRIHHSKDPRHFDTNFGVTLSIWDHLFGTQYRHYDEYPETGVPDPDFPNDPSGPSVGIKEIAKTMVAQLAYPFRSIPASLDLGTAKRAKSR